jgi:hypothetical protein
MSTSPLKVSLIVIGVVQVFFGILFLVAPAPAATLLGLTPPAPVWVNWLLAMMAARFLGYGAGMFVASRAPQRHLAWINTMIGIQLIDWVATLAVLLSGQLTIRQVSTAAVLPVLFIAALLWWHPRRTAGHA